ncbi:Cytochrome P450-33C9 [Aphelenchoides besseyi]|nr:Cytochrome P450-33C9 [Aphelenchoides besseyi]KAI6200734.1 Cytochrome P450-33C9 [Aphelenchoides besseyi]
MFAWIIVVLALFLIHNFYWKRRFLPPGPTPLPFFGNLIEFLRYPPGEKIQLQWLKKYGKVFTIWLGMEPLIVVADYNLIVDTFQQDGRAYEGRPDEIEYTKLVRGGATGVIFSEGQTWSQLRRFSLQTLRDFGVGKNLMQERIIDEIKTLFRRVNTEIRTNNGVVALDELVDLSVGSIINALMFNYSYTDDKISEFNDLKKRAQSFMKSSGHPSQRLIRTWPNFYRHLPYFKQRLEDARAKTNYLFDFFRERIDEHSRELNQNNLLDAVPSDFTMAFLKEQKKRGKQSEPFDYQTLTVLLFDLWVAGQETTSNTIGWAMAFIVCNSDVERRAHEELDQVINSDRLITLEDKLHLPYITAIVQESQRMANLLPINLLHRTTRDVKIENHFLPQGTWITPQVSVLMCNPEIYPNPEKFQPERFIDENGKLKRADELLPFSIGRRQCLGINLAVSELFLFIANLLNQYKFSPASKLPSLERQHGVTVRVNSYQCRMEKRFN